MTGQAEKGARFAALHEGPGAFVIPNPWDVGTTRILENLGFQALATTSAGLAFALGRQDGEGNVGRDEVLANAREIVEATTLPVSADLMACFGDAPETVAETIRLAGEAGLVGGSVEDATGRGDDPIYDPGLATERVAAAAEAARALPFPFTLTARAENFLCGRPDLDDTIARLQSYQEAGADVLYAPGLASREAIEAVVGAVDRPINVVMGLQGVKLSAEELGAIGVRRISVGSALSRAAFGAFLRAAREMQEGGTFAFAEDAVPFGEINRLFRVR